MNKPDLRDSMSLLIRQINAFASFTIANIPVRFTKSFPFVTPAFITGVLPVIGGYKFNFIMTAWKS
jgi:hypothetical protein